MKKKDNRTHILATAFKLFFQKGYKEVTMSELVKESGLSKGAFYHYFNSKEDLYQHSMEMFMDHYLSDFRMDYDESLSLKDNLKLLYAGFSPITEQLNLGTKEAAEGLSNYLLFLQGLMRKDEFREKMREFNINFTDIFIDWIDNAKRQGEILASLDSQLLARHFTSLMKGVGVLHAFVDEGAAHHTFNKIIDQFFGLIKVNHDPKK